MVFPSDNIQYIAFKYKLPSIFSFKVEDKLIDKQRLTFILCKLIIIEYVWWIEMKYQWNNDFQNRGHNTNIDIEKYLLITTNERHVLNDTTLQHKINICHRKYFCRTFTLCMLFDWTWKLNKYRTFWNISFLN